jgi:radical SAM superfamily enzyme YgiQ (UPF0313 family)
VRVILISTYELGRQPFGLASPAAWLRNAGLDVTCLDASRQSFDKDYAFSDLVGFHLPMHTATRLAVPMIEWIRQLNPAVRICCYGLYAPLNASFLRSLGVQHILGPEFERDLVGLATGSPIKETSESDRSTLPRLSFVTPDRTDLPELSRYATLQKGSLRKVVGYTEASRGCKHFCRHCPVVPVYNGQFRLVPTDVVIDDVRAQVGRGAEHITFGDPDFFNGIRHAMRVVQALSTEFKGLTYDVTIKIEHLLRYRELLPRLRETGCVLITSAVESFDDHVLAVLRKGHTRADVETALKVCRQERLSVAPTFVPFTPWTTMEGYCTFLEEIERLELIGQVSPIQLALRLLVPQGSPLADCSELQSFLQPFDTKRLVYPWRHPDQRVDRCSDEIGALVGQRTNTSRDALFSEIWELAHDQAGCSHRTRTITSRGRAEVPYLNEPWYC